MSQAGSVAALVRAVVSATRRAGTASMAGLGDAVDPPARTLSRRVVANAVQRPRPVVDESSLARALAELPRSPLLGGSTAAALGTRLARRFGPLRFLARRTPMWLVAAAVPALHASVSRGADELALVASHLVLRCRAEGAVPDVERVRRATVQVLAATPVDPGSEPRHGPLVLAWLRRAAKATLPLTTGVTTSDLHGLAAAAAAVPVAGLAGSPEDLPQDRLGIPPSG